VFDVVQGHANRFAALGLIGMHPREPSLEIDLLTRDLAALLGRESFEVFSAKLEQGAKKPSMQDSLRLTFRAKSALWVARKH
jgi:hypothetical protein